MATIPEITDRLTAATEKAEAASEIQYQVANADENTSVETASGPTPSIKKWYNDLGQELEPLLASIPVRLDRAILEYQTKAEADAAAPGLPNGSSVVVNGETQGRVSSGVYFPKSGVPAVSVKDYAEFDAFAEPADIVDVRAPGIAGRWRYAPGSSATPDGGYVRQLADGRKFIRDAAFVVTHVVPEAFREASDPVGDDTLPLQRALDTGRRVVIANPLRITDTVFHYGQQIVGTGFTQNSGTWAMTKIHVDGNFSAFKPKSFNGPVCADIYGLYLWYGDTTPLDASSNDQKRGFDLRNPDFPSDLTKSTQMTKISNCLVKGGWYAVDYSGGSYLTELERVWSWSCRMGIRYLGGTTLNMKTVYSLFGEQAFFIQGVANVNGTNIAMDRMEVLATTPQRAAAVFANIPGLNIKGFYSELNKIGVNEGSLVMVIECVGEISGITCWREDLSSSSGEEVYGYRVYGGRMKITGSAPQVSGEGLEFTGDGQVMGILAQGGAVLTIDTSSFPAPTGGTPSARYSAAAFGGTIYSHASDLSGGTDMSLPMVAGAGVAFTPTLVDFTITGTPIVTGSIRRSGSMCFIEIKIDPNGGTIASVPGTSYIYLPVTAIGNCVASVVNSAFSGGHGRINDKKLIMPYLGASSSMIYISAAVPVR